MATMSETMTKANTTFSPLNFKRYKMLLNTFRSPLSSSLSLPLPWLVHALASFFSQFCTNESHVFYHFRDDVDRVWFVHMCTNILWFSCISHCVILFVHLRRRMSWQNFGWKKWIRACTHSFTFISFSCECETRKIERMYSAICKFWMNDRWFGIKVAKGSTSAASCCFFFFLGMA